MSVRRSMISTLTAALVVAAAVPAAASAAPKLTDYKLTGGLTVWAEPKPAASGDLWLGCVAEVPKLTFTAVTEGKDLRLQHTPMFPFPGGLQWPLTVPLGFFPQPSIAVTEGANEIGGLIAFGLADYRTVPPFPSRVVSSGRATLNSSYFYNQRWNGLNVPVIKSLPTRSVPFKKLQKPAGSCATLGADSISSLYLY